MPEFETERACVMEFSAALESPHRVLSAPDFFDADPKSIRLDNAALLCLKHFGSDVNRLEDEELLACSRC